MPAWMVEISLVVPMRKCDWCKRNSVCRGVARSECIVRDYRDFVQEDTPVEAPIVYEPINGLIQELRYHARHSKNGKMGEECVVSKALLADAADKLEEILPIIGGDYLED